MGSIPLPALGVKPPEPPDTLGEYGKALQLKSLLQGQQKQQIEIQNAQMQQQDQLKLRGLYIKHQGDLDKVIADAPSAGISPKTIQDLQLHSIDAKTKTADLVTKQGAVALQQADLMAGAHDAVDKAPADQKPAIYQQQLQQLAKMGVDTSQMPPQYPGDDAFKLVGAVVKGHKQQVADAFKEREVAAQETQAAARKTAADAQAAKNAPLAPPVIDNLNKQLQARYQVLNPSQPLPPEFTLPKNAKRQDYEDLDKALEQVEKAQGVKAQQDFSRANAGANRSSARSDKSYQFNSGQLEKVAQPVDQAISRLGRLQDALNQGTPQADALIAPELLSVMAGGAGSGLRMNEAEISRIVGGRSKWESLQASINQWSLDPSKANSITPEQRKQIRDLVSEVDTKLKAKQAALDEARQGLINTDDPAEHKTIVIKARTKMTQIDQGQSSTPKSGMIRARDPQGVLHEAPAGTALPQGWILENK